MSWAAQGLDAVGEGGAGGEPGGLAEGFTGDGEDDAWGQQDEGKCLFKGRQEVPGYEVLEETEGHGEEVRRGEKEGGTVQLLWLEEEDEKYLGGVVENEGEGEKDEGEARRAHCETHCGQGRRNIMFHDGGVEGR